MKLTQEQIDSRLCAMEAALEGAVALIESDPEVRDAILHLAEMPSGLIRSTHHRAAILAAKLYRQRRRLDALRLELVERGYAA